MKLQQKQSEFVRMIGKLIKFANFVNYELTFGDAYRAPSCGYGHPTSLHRKRLAVDFNLFIDGEYKTKSEDYEILGRYWESIGGTWGGRFKDGNHFSLEHDGMK